MGLAPGAVVLAKYTFQDSSLEEADQRCWAVLWRDQAVGHAYQVFRGFFSGGCFPCAPAALAASPASRLAA
jgi:hypothetical protein